MAIDQNTRSECGGKADDAERIIAESLRKLHLIAAKLAFLQGFPVKSRLDREINSLQSGSRYIADAYSSFDTVLEDR